MYVELRDIESAELVFDCIRDLDAGCWNAMIGGYIKCKYDFKALQLLTLMPYVGVKMDKYTYINALKGCSAMGALQCVKQIHVFIIQSKIECITSVMNALMDVYFKNGDKDSSLRVFNRIQEKDIISWNTAFSSFSQKGNARELVSLYHNLMMYTPTQTLLKLVCRSENQEIGRQLHCDLLKSGFHSHDYVCSSLIKFYTTFGLLDNCYKFFNGPKKLDLVSWGTMISSLAHQGFNHEAMKFLQLLMKSGEMPDDFILASILDSCASIAAYRQLLQLASALIDAYAKCSDIENARVAFELSFKLHDVVIYNAMIMAYTLQGLAVEAMNIFGKMKSANIHPSQVTFISLISACSHNGLMNLGCSLFESMGFNYHLSPTPKIYGCLVYMLSRNGYLEDAKLVIEAMPFPSWPAIWRTLLSGCRTYENRALGEWASGGLLQLFPESNAGYVLLGKVFSESGSWEDAASLRKKMAERGVANSVVKT
ncbi:hypothetical protein K1719_000156 [Acacia pycnantha]|nr:hypothetical protein K1719_000156 [Acacia pycnantha]